MFLRGIITLYSWALPAGILERLASTRYSGWALLRWFWTTKTYVPQRSLKESERSASVLLGLLMLAQVCAGVGLLVQWARFGTAGVWAFGLALLLSYPLVWVHVVAVFAWAAWWFHAVLHPKKAARDVVCTILEWQVRQLRARHSFKVVAVVGSVGKTSTKLAIAQLLDQHMRVRWQTGNYNDRVTVPLVFFGLNEPSLYNPIAWLKAFGVTQSEIALPYPYDVVVVELGTDAPGFMKDFAYIKPDITVVTAVSPEHMELFGTLDAVAAEELKVFDYSKQVLVNGDDIAGEYLAGREFSEYSLISDRASYYATTKTLGLEGQDLTLHLGHGKACETNVSYIGKQGAKFALAAAGVAHMLGIGKAAIATGLSELQHFSGRMQILPGVDDATLIDDTYNASPLAMKAALDVLYAADATQRIAILGNMNEMGDYSQQAHEEVGAYCNAKKLDEVIVIGSEAAKWLAPAAQKAGCKVHVCISPYEAGTYVRKRLQKGAVVLAKGSQNGVFAEESLKPLLANPDDAKKLVRQSAYWLTRKRSQFADAA